MVQNFNTVEIFLLLSALAGAVHVLAPDHWIPTSLFSWQKRWRMSATFGFTIFSLVLHVASGFLIYLILAPYLARIQFSRFFSFAVGLVILASVIRALRFSRIREVLRLGPNWLWGAITVASLLGPCESIIPIFLKSRQLGAGYLAPFSAFAAGTLLMGIGLIFAGRWVWNSPIRMTRGIAWADRRRSVIPIAAVVVFGLIALLRLR